MLNAGTAQQLLGLSDFWLGLLLVAANCAVLVGAVGVGYVRHVAKERDARRVRRRGVKVRF